MINNKEIVENLNKRFAEKDPKDKYGNVRHVFLFGSQTGVSEDLYRTKESRRVLIRQDIGQGLVRWCTASKWTGGYEADCPVKEGLTIIAIDKKGNEIFREETFRTQWNGTGQADKAHPFSWEEKE